MILLDILRSDDWFNESATIEIAKGRHKLPESLSEMKYQLKRAKKWQKQ